MKDFVDAAMHLVVRSTKCKQSMPIPSRRGFSMLSLVPRCSRPVNFSMTPKVAGSRRATSSIPVTDTDFAQNYFPDRVHRQGLHEKR